MNLLDLDHLPFIFRCNDDGNPLNTMMGTWNGMTKIDKVCLAWFLYVHAINCQLSNYKSQRPQRPDFVLRQLSKWRFLFVQMRGQLVILFWESESLSLLMRHEKNHWSPNIVLHILAALRLSLSDFQEDPKTIHCHPLLSIGIHCYPLDHCFLFILDLWDLMASGSLCWASWDHLSCWSQEHMENFMLSRI